MTRSYINGFRLTMSPQGTENGFDRFSSTQQLKLYLDGGVSFTVEAIRNSTAGTAAIFARVSGYLVDTP